MDYELREVGWLLVGDGKPLFDETGYSIRLDDIAGGEFVIVESNDEDYGKIAIDPENWESLKSAIDRAISECRS